MTMILQYFSNTVVTIQCGVIHELPQSLLQRYFHYLCIQKLKLLRKTFIDSYGHKMGLLRSVLYIKPLTNEKSHSATTHRMVPFRSPTFSGLLQSRFFVQKVEFADAAVFAKVLRHPIISTYISHCFTG